MISESLHKNTTFITLSSNIYIFISKEMLKLDLTINFATVRKQNLRSTLKEIPPKLITVKFRVVLIKKQRGK